MSTQQVFCADCLLDESRSDDRSYSNPNPAYFFAITRYEGTALCVGHLRARVRARIAIPPTTDTPT